jgi:glycosyltransferase involved in cell wall biosynthesis
MVWILVPIYNTKHWQLKVCVRSVLRQTHKAWRCILVDDGSTNGAGAVCDAFAKKDKRIQVIHQANAGLFPARITGVAACAAQGSDDDHMMFLDSDDSLHPKCLEHVLGTAKQTGAEMVVFKWCRLLYRFRFYRSHSRARLPRVFDHDAILRDLVTSLFTIRGWLNSFWGKLWPMRLAQAMLEIPQVIHFFGEDHYANLHLLPQLNSVAVMEETLYNYRFGGGTARFMPHYLDDLFTIHQLHEDVAAKYGLPIDRNRAAAELIEDTFTWLCDCCLKGGYSMEALRAELLRCCALPEIASALRHPKPDSFRRKDFQEVLAEERYDDALAIVCNPPKPALHLRVIRKIAILLAKI